MSLRLSETRRRSQKRAWRRVIWLVFFIIVLAIASVFSYRLGVDNTKRPVIEFEQTIERLEMEKARLADNTATAAAALGAEREKTQQLQERYRTEIPNETARQLLALVTGKLEQGITPDRLAFVIDAAENRRSCDNVLETKRFIVQTPLYQGANSWVGFAGQAVTITGTGETSKDPDGNPEAWFDPAEPVTIRFTHIGGQSFEMSGKLPLHQSIVIDESEYRFTITQGPQGFVYVAGDSCKYP